MSGKAHPQQTTGTALALATMVVAVVGAVPAVLGLPSPDVAWMLHVAGRMLDGERLYVDVVEVNPPLIVWLNLPVAWLSRRLGSPDAAVFGAAVLALSAVSTALCMTLLRRLYPGASRSFRGVVALLLVFVQLSLAGRDFGEREHLMLMSVLPYVLAVVVRSRGVALDRRLAWVVGLLGGVGFALKPYFVPLWLILEGYLASSGRHATWRRPEALSVAAVFAGYLLSVLALSPEYFTLSRSLGSLYWGYLRGPVWLTGLLGEGSALPLCALLAYAALRRRDPGGHHWRVLALAVAGSFASALLQAKGWRYHLYPAMAFAVLLLSVMAWEARRPLVRPHERLYAATCSAVVVTVLLLTLWTGLGRALAPRHARYDADPDLGALRDAVRAGPPAEGLLVLSSNMASAFPLVSVARLRWTSRFPSVWLLAALYMDQLRSDEPLRFRPREAMGPAERYLNDAVVSDMKRQRPDVLVVLRAGPDRRDLGIRRLDYPAYFSREAEFARLFAGYGFIADVGEYRIYRLGAPRRPEPSAPAVIVADRAVAAGWDGLRGVSVEPAVLPAAGVLLLVIILAMRLETRRSG